MREVKEEEGLPVRCGSLLGCIANVAHTNYLSLVGVVTLNDNDYYCMFIEPADNTYLLKYLLLQNRQQIRKQFTGN